MGNKDSKSDEIGFFNSYSRGVATSRDAWCWNYSRKITNSNMTKMVEFYNSEVQKSLNLSYTGKVNDFINNDATKISWNRSLKNDFTKQKTPEFDNKKIVKGLYRPFTKAWIYFDKNFNDMIYQIPKLFPNYTSENKIIYISGSGSSGKRFSALMSENLPDLNMQHSGGQGFPLYLYNDSKSDGLTDIILNKAMTSYPNENITKEDIFFYVYGILHSEDYFLKYGENLSKTLPRVPFVKSEKDFFLFSIAGRELAELHLNYETMECYPVTLETGGKSITEFENEDYYVTKMKYAKNGKDKDLTTVIYNNQITIKNIPVEAYEYIVNGKPALDWVMERQGVSTDKKSQITNDANDWAIETMGNAKYPLELFQRVITVSLETMKIVKSLPKLDI